MEAGLATGDDNVTDVRFSGRALNGDYNVGLLIYDQILERVSRYTWTEAADGLWSRGGVYNSKYLFPQARFSPAEDWDIHAGFLMVWPHLPDGAVIRTDDFADANMIGWEADLAVKGRLHEHILISLEGGFAKVTDRVPYENWGLTNAGRVWTVQPRVAYEF